MPCYHSAGDGGVIVYGMLSWHT